jgi:hypothetical protein
LVCFGKVKEKARRIKVLLSYCKDILLSTIIKRP